MRTDALDCFFTRSEQRFIRGEIEAMMHAAGLDDFVLSDKQPVRVACGRRT